MDQTGKAWQGKTDGGTFGQRAMLCLFRYADVRVGYAAVALTVPFYMLFRHGNAAAIYDYFRTRQGYGRWKSLCSVYRNHLVFGEMLIDRFACYAGRSHKFRVDIDDPDTFSRLSASPEGFLMAGAHAGNFEMAGYLLHQDAKKIHGLIYEGETDTLQQNRRKVLARNHIDMIPVRNDMSHLFRMREVLDAGDVVCLPCDRRWGSDKAEEVTLLGAPALFPAGGFLVAATLGRPMMACFAMKAGTYAYRVHVRMLSGTEDEPLPVRQQAARMAARFADALDGVLRQYPLQWFNFYRFWN